MKKRIAVSTHPVQAGGNWTVTAVVGLGLLLATPVGVAAEQPPTSGAGMLAEVVVTASRTAETVDDSLAAVWVITREDIERGQYRSVADALASVPGLQFSRSGGVGKATGIFLRGTSTAHTLVLIDGLRIGSATTGGAALQHIPLSQIERIEVVRGPRSTLYGSAAVGGVIHIFTRKATDRQQGSVSLGGGSHGTHEARTTISGPHGDSHYSIALSHMGTRGFDAQVNNVPNPGGWGNTPDQPDRDGYREAAGSLRLGHRFSPGNELEVHALHSSGTTEYDGGWQNETDFRQQVLGLTARLRPLDFWDITLSGGQSRDEEENLKDGRFSSNFDTKREQLGWQNDLILGDHQLLTVGIDYHKDKVASSTAFDRESRDTTGLYLQHRLDYGNHGLLLGLRYEDNEQFGSHTTYNLGYGLRLPRNLRLTLNYGTAFRAPTFNELYFPADPVWGGGGNPDLEPEESKSYEVALQQQYSGGYWRLGVFRTEIDNLIAGWPPANINQARIDGLELESGHQLSKQWHLAANLTLLDPRDRESGNQLPRRSKRMTTLNLDGDFERWRAGLTAQGYSSRYDNLANTTRVPGYVVFALRAEYDVRDNLLLQGKIENLFDKKYQEVATYNTSGRAAFATLTYRF